MVPLTKWCTGMILNARCRLHIIIIFEYWKKS
eukprot:SAG11_NODE_19908_length_456_cov_1.857143_1_plen_31_part_01